MATKARSAPAQATEADPLHESVDRLAVEIRLLREVMDEIREDVSWVTRNGLLHQPIEHVVVKQMARDPCAIDWGQRLIIERHTNIPRSPLESGVLDQIASVLTATFEAIAGGQLEVVLAALDKVRDQLQCSLKLPEHATVPSIPDLAEAGTHASNSTATLPRETPPKGCLF